MNGSLGACERWREVIRLQVCEAAASEAATALAAHLATCARCRQYAEEMQRAAMSLRALAATPVEPSPRLRARWTAAVHRTAHPAPIVRTLAELLQRFYGFLRHNRGPLVALVPVWVLILALKLTLPEPGPAGPTAQAHSPVEILRLLKTQERLLAGQSESLEADRMLAPQPAANHPRSEAAPLAPSPRRAATRPASYRACASGTDGRQLLPPACTLYL